MARGWAAQAAACSPGWGQWQKWSVVPTRGAAASAAGAAGMCLLCRAAPAAWGRPWWAVLTSASSCLLLWAAGLIVPWAADLRAMLPMLPSVAGPRGFGRETTARLVLPLQVMDELALQLRHSRMGV